MCVCVRGFIPATWVAAIITYHPIRISVCQKKQRMKSLQSADCSIGGKGRSERILAGGVAGRVGGRGREPFPLLFSFASLTPPLSSAARVLGRWTGRKSWRP